MRVRRITRGFTLIELLLVAAIISVVAAITVPTFVKSMRGNRLRSAARTVVMMGRYARSMSLLKQQEMALKFDINGSTVSIHPIRMDYTSGQLRTDTEMLLEAQASAERDEDEEETDDEESAMPAHLQDEEVSRTLDQVLIDFVELDDGDDRVSDGSCLVRYKSNGTCTPYNVRIVDEHGEAVLVKVNMLSSTETERD